MSELGLTPDDYDAIIDLTTAGGTKPVKSYIDLGPDEIRATLCAGRMTSLKSEESSDEAFIFRICGAALAAALVLSALPAVPARAAGIQVTLNDQPLSFSDAQPLMRDDRTFVPFRAIFETMGATVSWDDASRTVTAKRSDRTVKLTIGRKGLHG